MQAKQSNSRRHLHGQVSVWFLLQLHRTSANSTVGSCCRAKVFTTDKTATERHECVCHALSPRSEPSVYGLGMLFLQDGMTTSTGGVVPTKT